MPNDPLLYPSIAGPQQQMIARQGNLEARIAALEAKRDVVFTPLASLHALNSFILPYYGGRMWCVLAANGQAGGTATVTNTLFINGSTIPGGIGAMSIADAGGSWSQDTVDVFQIPAASLNLGNNTLTMTQSGGVFGSFSGLFVEWPQA